VTTTDGIAAPDDGTMPFDPVTAAPVPQLEPLPPVGAPPALPQPYAAAPQPDPGAAAFVVPQLEPLPAVAPAPAQPYVPQHSAAEPTAAVAPTPAAPPYAPSPPAAAPPPPTAAPPPPGYAPQPYAPAPAYDTQPYPAQPYTAPQAYAQPSAPPPTGPLLQAVAPPPPGYPSAPYPSAPYPSAPYPSAPYPSAPYAPAPYGYPPQGYAQPAYPVPAYGQPYGQQPYGQQPYPPQGYGPPGQPAVRRYPPVLPIQGRRPPLWVFLVILAVFLAPGIYYSLRYGPIGDEPFVPIRGLGLIEAGFAIGVVVLTVLFRWSRSVGWVPRPHTALPVPIIAMVLIATSALLILTAGVSLSWRASAYVFLLLNFLAVGVFEETMFRGLLWAALPERWSASKVLLVTSLGFGAVHVTNGFTTGRWDVAVVQACVVSVAGLGLGALRMRSGWIALGVITHAFIDAGLAAVTAVAPHMKDVGPGEPLPGSLVLASLLMLALLGLYATLGISGIVVLVRTFRSERQLRRLAAWFPGAPAAPGASATWPPGPPTLVG
jgi:membrane protease YdiL (CAAX protease family)